MCGGFEKSLLKLWIASNLDSLLAALCNSSFPKFKRKIFYVISSNNCFL